MKYNDWGDQYVRKFKGMPEVSYGKCTHNGCRSISDLADGLCVKCWDRTSYKCDLEKKSEDCVEKLEESTTPSGAKRTGNTRYMSNFIY